MTTVQSIVEETRRRGATRARLSRQNRLRPVNPIIVDADTGDELWTAGACADHLGVTVRQWETHVTRGPAPKAVGQIGRLRLWQAQEVHSWAVRRKRTNTALRAVEPTRIEHRRAH
ncbi:hypothetical protein JVX90_07315 [Gordonia sp. PDNC005]|uniref:hypothetical protein n=1 Tax=unclassified Gordonia (in: high G+C Gram-positive bacteria) TaxID=2657482 RepID=UPI001962CEA0|nr:hypothetical protein [Gordonia sp. PDNC005]QRY63987.1 hypothetical protein JVX90_07315 [Gordonia sp. PDNC005]